MAAPGAEIPTLPAAPPPVSEEAPAPVLEQAPPPVLEQAPPLPEQAPVPEQVPPPVPEQAPPVPEQAPPPVLEQAPPPVLERAQPPSGEPVAVLEQAPPPVLERAQPPSGSGEPVAVLEGASPPQATAPPPLPEAPARASLPLLMLGPDNARSARKRTTAILRVGAQAPALETPLPRPVYEVQHRACPLCAEEINARATECFYCAAAITARQVGGLTRRILPGQLAAGRGGQSRLALRCSLLGVLVPVFALSLIGIGLAGQAYLDARGPENKGLPPRDADGRRALKAIWLGLLGCVISTGLLLKVWR